jgi:2-keto-4-pentenoate hydratase
MCAPIPARGRLACDHRWPHRQHGSSMTEQTATPGSPLPIADDAAVRAAQILFDAWQQGDKIVALPEACRPATRADGYAIQSALLRLSGRNAFGWKVAATSAAGQAHIGVDGPLAGRLLSGQIHVDGAVVPIGGNRMRVAETEFAFRMSHDLPPRQNAWTLAEVMAAVDALHLAIEIPDSRFENFVTAGAPQLIADNACAHRFVMGPEAAGDWRSIDLSAHVVKAEVRAGDTLRYTREGQGSNVLGDPRIALTWIANELSALGIGLRAGEVVTTGTCVVPLEFEAGDAIRADYGVLGRVAVRIA